MIKSFHKLLVPRRERDFAALVDLFDALGLARGESWKGRRSQGLKMEAPSAGVELGIGQGFPDADLVIEVDSADAAYDLLRKHGAKIASDIADCDWGARLFTIDLPANAGRLAVFSYNEDWRKESSAKQGQLDATGLRFGIVVSRFNAFITERLLAGAIDALTRTGARTSDITVVRVPGAFEIPSAARDLAKSGKVDAVVCIGCLIRGDTLHYEVIANEVTRGIGQSAQETGVPHAFGVLTTENLEQAIDRAGLKAGNKGFEAGLAAVEMASLKKQSAVSLQRKTPSAIGSRPSGRASRTQSQRSRKSRNNRRS